MSLTDDRQDTGGLAFATPADWVAISLPREAVQAGRVAQDLVAGQPELAGQRELLTEVIGSLIEACAALDVLAAYCTILDVPGQPLPVTLTASVHPMGQSTIDDIAREMSPAAGGVMLPAVRVLDLPAGRSVRIERLREWPASEAGQSPVSFVVQYVTEAPGTGSGIMLTFSTSAVALSGQLRVLFHEIACTLRFDGPGPPP